MHNENEQQTGAFRLDLTAIALGIFAAAIVGATVNYLQTIGVLS